MDQKEIDTPIVESQNGCGKIGDGTKRVYGRKDLEALRFVKAEEQSKRWIEVYGGLGPAGTKDYNDLVECKHQKSIYANVDPKRRLKKKKQNPMCEESSRNMNTEIEKTNLVDLDSCTGVEGECSDSDDSDDAYNNIQKPAFYVTGVPNFDSGPPEDGLEYLRRVRWEAAQVPKVKVVKLESSKVKKEQTAYMPIIPDIAKCPEHLQPLKQWEDAFLADFSELRRAFSHFESPGGKFSIGREGNSHDLMENAILKSFNELTTDAAESCETVDCSSFDNSSSRSSLSCDELDFGPKPCVDSNPPNNNRPTLSAILKMDSVARSSMLRKRISSVETVSTLSRSDCEWLFALCVAVDTPLDADMCAALRCLLRKSASLRAAKSELDDEAIMLDILATISGRYFGQSES